MEILLTFIILQILDGLLTFTNLFMHGIELEGNIILVFLMNNFGLVNTIIGAKIFASIIGIIVFLYFKHWKIILTVLNLIYLCFAVLPWMIITVTQIS